MDDENDALTTAIELFRQDQVSLSRAAEIAGTDQWSFRDVLRQHEVPIVIEVPEAAEMDARIRKFFNRKA